MFLSPDVMRACLAICLLGMAILAALFLSRRSLSASAYLGWGLLILLVPLLGPFLVVLLQPGKPLYKFPRPLRGGARGGGKIDPSL